MTSFLKFYWTLLTISVINYGCSGSSSKLEELQLKEKEIELRERELELKQKELALTKQDNKTVNSKSLTELYSEVKKGVFLVSVKKKGGDAFGSAFSIDDEGLMVSNYHVFEQASEAILYNELDEKFMISEIVAWDREKDYIIFRVNNAGAKLTELSIAKLKPKIGESCFAVGNPNGMRQTLSQGIISSLRNNDETIQTTAEITHGSSGGPLFNSNGEVIGITSSGHGEANINFAVNIQSVPLPKDSSDSIYDDYDKSELSNDSSISKYNKDTIDPKKLVLKYYDVLLNNDFEALTCMYSIKMKRFYNKFNVARDWVIEHSKTYDKIFGVTKKQKFIRWDTFSVRKFSNGGYYIDFTMDYKLTRKDPTKPTDFVLDIIMEVNKDGKIYSIYENIIEKN